MGILSKFNDSVELEYMSEVDAALRNRGNKWAYRLSLLLMFAFAGFIVWSLVAERNEVTRGTGQITPSLGVQPIQSEQGGVIEEIFVKEGQEVKKGDRLVQMSNIEAVAEYESLLSRQVESSLALKRLIAESGGLPLNYTQEETIAYPDVVHDQMRLYNTRKERFESGNREIAANIEQKRRAVEEFLSRKEQHDQNLRLLQEQVTRVRPLVERRVYPEVDYLNLMQRVASLQAEQNTLVETISRTQTEVREEEQRLANRDSEWQAQVTAERDEYRRQLNTITERISAGSHQVEISELRAPLNGVIRRILLKEENVAQRAQPIMELLPTDDTLEVDARFQPQYRGYLAEGMEAVVKVEAYDFTIFGALPAVVTRISPDTIEDSRGQAWFEVRLTTESATLTHDGEELAIKPGMTVTVDVISGKKNVFSYIMKPFLKSQQEGNIVGRSPVGTESPRSVIKREAAGTISESPEQPDVHPLPDSGAGEAS